MDFSPGSNILPGLVFGGQATGGIPFGYGSCWVKENGAKRLQCDVEHSGGIHVHPTEGPMVSELFKRYASGTTTLSQLAEWLNSQGFRTRNTKNLPDENGNLSACPRLFTTASVRGILHNPFYAGNVSYKGKLLPGIHQTVISQEVFDLVQVTLKQNSGRSETLHPRPERHYLLKGIIRCAYCGMPMWAQTYKNGQRYYREHKGCRSHGICEAAGGSIQCHLADEQVSKLVKAIELGPHWLEEVLARISLKDEVEEINLRRRRAQQKLQRLGRAYVDGLIPEEDYHRQRRSLQFELESLVVPGVSAAEEAGRLLLELPLLWDEATEEERRKLLVTMLDAVYVDTKETRSIVAIKPKPPFRPIPQVAVTREGSGVLLINEPPDFGPEASLCFWWRRGRVELPVQRSLPKICYRLS